jgi:hypothetical protein
MTDALFLKMIQTRTATIAIGPSTLRNQGKPKVVSTAREFLQQLDLDGFSATTAARFEYKLEKETEKLRSTLPVGARNWGAARKALNIFLRDAFYSHYLRDEYRLAGIEWWLELPLDKYSALGLRDDIAKLKLKLQLPRWPGVKHLEVSVSACYQHAASLVAQRRKIARVHLDLSYFRREEL